MQTMQSSVYISMYRLYFSLVEPIGTDLLRQANILLFLEALDDGQATDGGTNRNGSVASSKHFIVRRST
jgi:hypothetical protein